MYRLIVESLLGLQPEVDKLRFAPCLPADWTDFKIHYRYRETFYHVTVHQAPDADPHAALDGRDVPGMLVPWWTTVRITAWRCGCGQRRVSNDDEVARRTRARAARSPGPSRHAPSG